MRGKGSPYEVRCLRCDVSFPLETKRCIHCGGPTSASTSDPAIVSTLGDGGLPPLDPFGRGGPFSRTRPPAGASAPLPPGAAMPAPPGASLPAPPGDPVESDEAGPTSIGATLLRSFGSLFWIIALVAFSMLRNCQGEG